MYDTIADVKTHILRSIIIFQKSCCLWDNVERYGIARYATDDNIAHVYCMLDISDYIHTQNM